MKGILEVWFISSYKKPFEPYNVYRIENDRRIPLGFGISREQVEKINR